MHAYAFTCDHERCAADLVLQAGRCFSGGVNGGGFDSQNWILTEVLLKKRQGRACIILLFHHCPGFAAFWRCARSHYICRRCRCGWSVGVSHPCTRCRFPHSSVAFAHPRTSPRILSRSYTAPDAESTWPGISRRVAAAEVQVRSCHVMRCFVRG